jgi:protein SCO1
MRIVILSVCCLALACGRSSAPRASDFQASPDARRFGIAGKVVSVEAAKGQVTLAHERIPDFMEPMTMPFTVREKWAFDVMSAGDIVRGTLVVDGSRSWIEGVSVAEATAPPTAAARGSWVPAEPGTSVPAVTLRDQDNRTFTFERFRGHPVLVTFSFTRCPLPEYCPLMTRHFAAIEQGTAASPELADVRLLTVTLDPDYDTPAVLEAYGAKHATGKGPSDRFARWTFATGTGKDIKTLASFFGLDYYPEGDRIIHALRTGVIDPEGRVVKVFEGNAWTVQDVLAELDAVRGRAKT